MLGLGLEPRMYFGICWDYPKPNGRTVKRDKSKNNINNNNTQPMTPNKVRFLISLVKALEPKVSGDERLMHIPIPCFSFIDNDIYITSFFSTIVISLGMTKKDIICQVSQVSQGSQQSTGSNSSQGQQPGTCPDGSQPDVN